MDSSHSNAFPGLRYEIRRILGHLEEQSPLSLDALELRLTEYTENLGEQAKGAEFFDLDTAQRVAELCQALLEALPDSPNPKQYSLTQLAIEYFVLNEDAEDDSESLIGFDDDLEVVTLVIRELGLDHLLEAAD